MPTDELTLEERHLLEPLLAAGERAPSLEEKLIALHAIRGRSHDRGQRIDQFLLEHVARLTEAVAEARLSQDELRQLIEAFLRPPWHSAVFLSLIEAPEVPPRALVLHGASRRVVNIAEAVDPGTLVTGDEVFLGHELNLVVGRSPDGAPRCGETALFQCRTADGRLVLKWRDEAVVVGAAGALAGTELQVGDQLRWDRAAWLAFEKIAGAEGREFLLEEVPDVAREQIGGQDANVDAVLAALTATLVAPDTAARYGLGNRHSILMHGPPGCGKTLLARVAAAEVSRISGRRCKFAVVPPAAWESPWVGETQQRIRGAFATLRAAATGGYAIMVLDEIEAVGRIRGSSVGHHSDKFLAALLAELDGFADRQGIAIIAVTNRKDLVDPALLERLSDLEVAVGRPDLSAARAIFEIHLGDSLPYTPNGTDASVTRAALIDTAVSRFYGPNAGNELCTLRFRDGTARTVTARELASGRTFEQVCRAARRAAFLREVRTGDPGLRLDDIECAVADTMDRLASTLSVRNAHAYLSDLPQDVDVVSVEPIVRKVRHAHRYFNTAQVTS